MIQAILSHSSHSSDLCAHLIKEGVKSPRDAQWPTQPRQMWTHKILNSWNLLNNRRGENPRNRIFDQCKALLVKATVCRLRGEGSRIIIGKGVHQDSFSVLIFPSFCLPEDIEGDAVPLLHSLYRQDEGFVILGLWTLSTLSKSTLYRVRISNLSLYLYLAMKCSTGWCMFPSHPKADSWCSKSTWRTK